MVLKSNTLTRNTGALKIQESKVYSSSYHPKAIGQMQHFYTGALGVPLRIQPLPLEAGRCEILDLLKAFGVILNCYEDRDSLSGH